MLVREMKITYRKRGEVEGVVNSSDAAAAAVRLVVGDDPREHLCVLYLDTRLGQIDVEIISIGSIDQSIASVREIFRGAIARSASGIVLAHQHPTGDPEPSEADYSVTERIAAAGFILGIPLHDHIVVGEGRHVSIRSRRPEWFPTV
jgi:DNA repair protein RadC